jgi:anti-sigma B factor antagonist
MLENTMADLLAAKNFRIIIDLGEVDYISSAGWGIFISEIKNIRKNKGDLKLVNMKAEVMEIFELLDFTNILEYYKSIDEAVKKFK